MANGGNVTEQIDNLRAATISELVERYKQLFGQKPPVWTKVVLVRQLAHKLQEQALGGISPAAKTRIQELIRIYDPIHKVVIKSSTGKTDAGRDIRLPVPGSLIVKTYKGKRLEVKVLEQGFEYNGVVYNNLSSVARAVTGIHWNGYLFFGIKQKGSSYGGGKKNGRK